MANMLPTSAAGDRRPGHGKEGWSVFPRTGEAHALIVRTAGPIRAQAFDLTFCFLSGQPLRYFGNFAISYTTDARPTLAGKWERLVPRSFSATGTTLKLEPDGRLVASRADSMIGDAVFQLRVQAPLAAVTGFRVDVIPFERLDAPGPRVAWNEYRDFCLTEFRVEAIQASATTNVALGCAVTASHPLWAGLSANVLTDRLPGSFNHPADPGLGSAFHFDVDLGAERPLDHLALRSRADGYGADRLSRVRVQLYVRLPEDGVAPAWEAMARADGSHPGRRKWMSSRERWSRGLPRKVSADFKREPGGALAAVGGDGSLRDADAAGGFGQSRRARVPMDRLEAPPGTTLLRVALSIPGSRLPDRLPIRWRLRGLHDDWQITDDPTVEVVHPPPGDYRFERRYATPTRNGTPAR